MGDLFRSLAGKHLPRWNCWRLILEKEDLTPHSYAFKAHEKQTGGLELLRALLAVHYPVPEDLTAFCAL